MISHNSAIWAELIWAFILFHGAGSSKMAFSFTGLVPLLGWQEELGVFRRFSLQRAHQ